MKINFYYILNEISKQLGNEKYCIYDIREEDNHYIVNFIKTYENTSEIIIPKEESKKNLTIKEIISGIKNTNEEINKLLKLHEYYINEMKNRRENE